MTRYATGPTTQLAAITPAQTRFGPLTAPAGRLARSISAAVASTTPVTTIPRTAALPRGDRSRQRFRFMWQS